MDEGFIKLYRKLLCSPIMLDAEALQVFIYFLLRARHKSGPARMNGKTISLEPGQLITGRFVLAEALGLTPSKVRRILAVLKDNDQISQQINAKFSIISITNWADYQVNSQLTASSPPADRQLTATNKKEEKGENETPTACGEAETLDSHGMSDPGLFPPDTKPKKAKAKRATEEQCREIIDYLNRSTGKKFRYGANNTVFIDGRLNEGFTVEDFKTAIDNKVPGWKGDPKMDEFLQPKTLFNKTNFEGYVNAVCNTAPNSQPRHLTDYERALQKQGMKI